jgi:hypothetical protein
MAIDKAKDYLRLILASGINNVTTTINLVDGAEAPDPATFGEYSLVIYKADDKSAMDYPNREQVRVIAKPSTHVLTVTRGYGGTVANYHNEAGKEYYLEQAFTASHLEQIRTDVSSGLSSQNWASPRAGLIFDGIDDFTTTPSNANLSFPDKVFTMQFEFTWKGKTSRQHFFDKGEEYQIFWHEGGSFVYRANSSQTDWNWLPVLGKKYFFEISANGNNISLLIDNKLILTKTLSYTYNLSNNRLQFGALGVANLLSADHYGTRFFNCILTDSERLHYWNQGKPMEAPILPQHRGGRQNLYVSNFASGLDGWNKNDNPATGVVTSLNNTGGKLTFECITAGNTAFSPDLRKPTPMKKGIKYQIKMKYNIISGNPIISYILNGSTTVLVDASLLGSNEFIYSLDTVQDFHSFFLYFDGRTLWSLDILSIEIKQLGCTYEVLGENMGRLGIIDTSGNGNNGNTSGSPVSLGAENRPDRWRDYRGQIVANTTLTNIALNGYETTKILLRNTTANPVVVNIGTSTGGNQLTPTAVTVPANDIVIITVNKFFSISEQQTLFIHSTNWNSASLGLFINQEKRLD